MQEKMVEQAEAESNKLSLRTSYLTYLAKKQGLLGFTAEVLVGNEPVFQLFKKMGFSN